MYITTKKVNFTGWGRLPSNRERSTFVRLADSSGQDVLSKAKSEKVHYQNMQGKCYIV